jgi:wobble nucleotide-excising tRNase
MSTTPFADLSALATHLRSELDPPPPQSPKKFVLLYAFNGTGKTRLSVAFRDLGREVDEFGETTKRDTLYFNAYTEDLFVWDNDLEGERQRVLELNDESKFFKGLRELEMEVKIGKLLQRYTDLNFYIEYDRRKKSDHGPRQLPPAVTFFRERTTNGDPIPIKVSRGEENIFIWSFFLAIVQLVLDGEPAYDWVKYIYIDDPISSLDENNAIAVANHLTQMLAKQDKSRPTVVSTHHPLFFNVLCNELGKRARKYFLKAAGAAGGYIIDDIDGQEFLHHLSALAELNERQRSGDLYTHHFNMMRRIMEQTANFFGMNSWKDCIRPEADDPDKTLYERVINLMSHGDYSMFEAKEMMDENKDLFRRIFRQFISIHPFNPERFPN